MFSGTGTCILLESWALSLRVGTLDLDISYNDAETDLFLLCVYLCERDHFKG